MSDYVKVTAQAVPANVRFDVPGANQGQMIEVAYGGFSHYAHGAGDPYMRVRSPDGDCAYYKLVESE